MGSQALRTNRGKDVLSGTRAYRRRTYGNDSSHSRSGTRLSGVGIDGGREAVVSVRLNVGRWGRSALLGYPNQLRYAVPAPRWGWAAIPVRVEQARISRSVRLGRRSLQVPRSKSAASTGGRNPTGGSASRGRRLPEPCM